MKCDNLTNEKLLSKIEKLEHDLISTKNINKKLIETEEKNSIQSGFLNTEEQLNQQSLDLRFLNSMAISLAAKPKYLGFSKALLKGVQKHTNALAAVFSLYDSEKKALVTKHFEVEKSVMQKALKIAGEKILNIASPINDETYALIIKSTIGICDNFVDVSFGAIPKIVDKAIRVATGISRIYAIGHFIDGQLYGTSTLSFKKNQAKPSMEMLESYAHLMAVYVRNSNAAKALKDSEQRFRFLAENSKDMIYRMSIPEAVYEYVSPASFEIFGYTPEDFYSIPLLIEKVIHPDCAEYLKSEWHKMIDGNIQPFYEYQIIHKSGEIKWINQRNTLIKDENEKPIAIEAVVTDVTKRKQMEEALLNNQNRYEKAQAIGHVGNWEYDPVSTIFWASDETKRIYGYDLDIDNFTIEIIESCIPERERVHQALIDLIEHNKEYNLVFDIIPFDKSTQKTILSIAELEKDAKGNIVKITGVVSDITKQKHVENELILAKEKAEESDRLKSAFLANMSHEIRTPMNGIIGFTNLLKEPGLTGEDQQKFVKIIEKSGNRMLSTINDIVDISKIEAGQVDVIFSDINLNKQMDELLEFFMPEAKKKNIQLSITNRIPDQHAIFKSDIEKLNSILINIIKNALKYTLSGSIKIGYSINVNAAQNEIEFYVKDTGIGIPKERHIAVFKRFVQADIDDRQAFEGSGLGLAISKAYVEMLGGKIWVESKEGDGSQFYFKIPYTNNTKEIKEKNSENSYKLLPIKKKLKILIVEDDEIALSYLSILLKEYNHYLLITKTGIGAVEMCRENLDIDLILMDIKIPGMNGYEATREIRKFNEKVFILAQTAYAQSGDRKKSIKAGCNEHITKPINKERLLEIISNQF